MRLTLRQLLDISGTTDPMLKALRLRHQLSLAFGQSQAFESLSYVPLDCVALLLNATLAKSYARNFAASLTRVWWPEWTEVAAYAEADPDKPANFHVVDFTIPGGKAGHMVAGSQGDVDVVRMLSFRAPKGAQPERETKVNLIPLIRFVRDNAARHGVDLLMPFVPPAGDPRLADLIAPWREARERTVDMLKAIRRSDEEGAARAGKLARSALEAYAGRPEGVAVQ
jgi:hypothetical protein